MNSICRPLRSGSGVPRSVLLGLSLLIGLLSGGLSLPPRNAAANEAGCASAAASAVIGAWQAPGQVVDGLLNIRTGPGRDCAVIGVLATGSPVTMTGDPVARGRLEWVPVSTWLGDGFAWSGGLGDAGPAATAVPVLMYHRINDYPGPYEVSTASLDAQLGWLSANGYQSVLPSDLAAFIDAGAPLPPKPVIFSIDDGFVSSIGFANILAQYGFRGSYFIPNQASGRLNDDQIAWLAQTGEVCAHTVDHADLATLTADQQMWEIATNKQWLEAIVGAPVTCFAYPYGSYTATTTGIVAGAGFTVAFDAWGGVQALAAIDRWHIRRIDTTALYTAGDLAAAIG